jgi:DNA-binding PadR family transcriptional regulator
MEPETVGQRNRRLYGRRIPRSHRRVMLALIAADGLSGYPLSRIAQVSSGSVYVVLAHLEQLGWVDREKTEAYAAPVRFGYTLTSKGRACVTLLLGLPAGATRTTTEASDG